MKLSVIIPYYNAEDSLEKLLESVICEAEDTQIIVVNDNSTRGIVEYEKIKEKFAGVVEFYDNDTGVKGAGAARNVGLKHAGGDWFLFADSDDYFMPGWFDVVKQYMDKEYDIVYFNPTSLVLSTGEQGQRQIMYTKYVKKFVNVHNHDSELFLRYFFIVPWSKLIRASTVRENDIVFDEVMYSNDVMFSIKTGFYAKTIYADVRNIYCVVEKSGTLTQNPSEESWGMRHEVFSRRSYFLKEHLNKEDYRFNKFRMGSAGRLIVAIQRRCGFKNFVKYCKMYKDNKVPVWSSFCFIIACKIYPKLKNVD